MRRDSTTLTDKVRFVLSDDSGAMRFKRFDILDAPECSSFVADVQSYLSGRALSEIDISHVRRLCRGNCPECVMAIEGVLHEYQHLFGDRPAIEARPDLKEKTRDGEYREREDSR